MHHEHSLKRSRRNGLLGFPRADLSVPPFILAAFGAAFVSSIGAMAWAYADPKDLQAVISYTFLLLFFPAFLVAIIPRRWTSLPLWVCYLAIAWAGLSRPRAFMEPYRHRDYLYLLCIVLLTELARVIRSPR